MTLVNDPQAEDRLNEALRCIGLIAVGAAALEANLASLADFSTDDLEHEAALKLSNKRKVQVIRAGLQTRRNLMGSERRDAAGRNRAIAWAEKALELLKLRGDLMHSQWLVARLVADRRAPKEWLSFHLSSGQRTPVDPENLSRLADDIAEHARRYQRVWHFAMRVYPLPRSEQDRLLAQGKVHQ